jgi:methylmalonyl-CoA mutase cobalamin-binding domain/chain
MGKLTQLGTALAELREGEVYDLLKKRLEEGVSAMEVINECNAAMVEVGKRFEENKYFISELIMSGEIFKNINTQLENQIGFAENLQKKSSKGTVIIGTVKNDIHDIGKNIAVILLKGCGYDVVDLGVDVPAEKFAEALREKKALVIGLSCLLNIAFPSLKKVVDEISKSGLRDQVKIMIGGAACSEEIKTYAGADFYAKDAGAGVTICDKIYGND